MHPGLPEGYDRRKGPDFDDRAFPSPRVAEEFRWRLKLLIDSLPKLAKWERDPGLRLVTLTWVAERLAGHGFTPIAPQLLELLPKLAPAPAAPVDPPRPPALPPAADVPVAIIETTPTANAAAVPARDAVTVVPDANSDAALMDIRQAYDTLRAKYGKAPSQRAVAVLSGYDRETVRKRWNLVKTHQNQPP